MCHIYIHTTLGGKATSWLRVSVQEDYTGVSTQRYKSWGGEALVEESNSGKLDLRSN